MKHNIHRTSVQTLVRKALKIFNNKKSKLGNIFVLDSLCLRRLIFRKIPDLRERFAYFR